MLPFCRKNRLEETSVLIDELDEVNEGLKACYATHSPIKNINDGDDGDSGGDGDDDIIMADRESHPTNTSLIDT